MSTHTAEYDHRHPWMYIAKLVAALLLLGFVPAAAVSAVAGQAGSAGQVSYAGDQFTRVAHMRGTWHSAALVNEQVLKRTEGHEILKRVFTTVRRVLDVMAVQDASVGAARQAAAPVAGVERAANRQ